MHTDYLIDILYVVHVKEFPKRRIALYHLKREKALAIVAGDHALFVSKRRHFLSPLCSASLLDSVQRLSQRQVLHVYGHLNCVHGRKLPVS